MATITIPLPRPKSNLTRRRALQGTVACGALALPAGAAVAASGLDFPNEVDPGLAEIEAGYKIWQWLEAEKDRLREQRDALCERARAAVRPMMEPEPAIPPELLPYSGPYGVYWGTVPRRGKVSKIADAYMAAELDWRHAFNALLDRNSDYEASRDLDTEAEERHEEAQVLRKEVLAIPTTSPRGLLLKLALAMEARSLDAIEEMLAAPSDSGVFDGWVGEDLLPPLLADLRAMVGRAA